MSALYHWGFKLTSASDLKNHFSSKLSKEARDIQDHEEACLVFAILICPNTILEFTLSNPLSQSLNHVYLFFPELTSQFGIIP